MAYDEELANRIRELVLMEDGITEKRMFGGLVFMVNGNMSVTASRRGGMMLRVDPSEADALLRRQHAEQIKMRNRVMPGWIFIHAEGLRTKRQLARWVARGIAFAKSLPSKS
jgi:TfoX/Sxy family transcriptional regulator of competence genes